MSNARAGRSRPAAVKSATASVAMDGLRTSAESDRDAEAYVNGELTAEELVARAKARCSNPPERRPRDADTRPEPGSRRTTA
ncbi:antitoxin VbhA family protein [Streptomyces spiramyceticus]|uniref:antitoxin VbhA family protein n=1 Tax=Streptomyces spiramyceticus TaxID=299717 RepID=UPI00237A34CF|nr:antitoxin VbhA family protein [Streptomyces spiramyceticus]